MRWVDSNGDMQTIAVKEGENYSIAIPEREGYIFNGLFDEEVGGTQYVGSNGLSIASWSETADRNLFAQWSPKNITISFDACGGIISESNINVTYDSNINVFPIPTKEGHIFVGWHDGQSEEAISFSNALSIPIKAKMTYSNYPMAKEKDEFKLYALWDPIPIPVIFNSNKGSINPSLASTTTTSTIEILWGRSIEMYAPDSGEFSAFDTPAGGIKGILKWSQHSSISGIAFSDLITEPMTLYAHWAPAIIFDMQGGPEKKPLAALANSSISLGIPERAGFTFEGWVDEDDNSVMLTTMPESGARIRATWEIITYTITYNYNGGSVINGMPLEYTIQTPNINLSANTTKQGYEFGGWYDNAEFNGNSIAQIAKGSYGNKALYAKWTPVWYITYELGGGTVSGNPGSFTMESDAIQLKNPTRENHVFTGWYSQPNSKGTWYTEISPSQGLNNRILYAGWYNHTEIQITNPYSLSNNNIKSGLETYGDQSKHEIAVPDELKNMQSLGLLQVTIEVVGNGSTRHRSLNDSNTFSGSVYINGNSSSLFSLSAKGGGWGALVVDPYYGDWASSGTRTINKVITLNSQYLYIGYEFKLTQVAHTNWAGGTHASNIRANITSIKYKFSIA